MVVRGPTSALSSFLRERGITAVGGRFDRARQQNDHDDQNNNNNDPDQTQETHQEPSESDEASSPVPIVASSRANRQFKTTKAKPKGKKKKPSISDDDDDDGGRKVNPNSADPNLDVCVRCQTRFRASIGATTHSLCPECLSLSTVSKATSKTGQRKRQPKKVKTVHEVSLVEELNSDLLSLQDLCIKMISKYIEGVESFEAVSDKAKEKICRIICKHRQLNNQTVKLFCDVHTKDLSLYDCAYLNEDGFCSIAYFSSNLERIHLGECGQITNTVLDALAHNCPKLTSISLQGCYLIKDAEMASFLETYPELTHLKLDNSLKLGKMTLEQASKCPKLVQLSLRSCPSLRDDHLSVLENCRMLKELDVSCAPDVTGVGFTHFLPSISAQLKSLNVSKCTALKDDFLDLLATHCRNLVDLDLSFLESITDDGVSKLWPSLVNLESINLERVFHLTDAAFNGLYMDDSTNEHFPSCILQLRHVNLNSLVQVSSNVFLKIAQQTKSLESLDISWCQQVNDDALEGVIQNNPNLKAIQVWGCAGVSELLMRDILRDTREHEGRQWLQGIGMDMPDATSEKGKTKASKYHGVRLVGVGFLEEDSMH